MTSSFNEPELFDWPHLREVLKQWRIPSLHLEFEPEDGLSNQTLTRLEAFLEVLEMSASTLSAKLKYQLNYHTAWDRQRCKLVRRRIIIKCGGGRAALP